MPFLRMFLLARYMAAVGARQKERMAASVVKNEELDICLFVASESKKKKLALFTCYNYLKGKSLQ